MLKAILFDAFGTLFSFGNITSAAAVHQKIPAENRPPLQDFQRYWKEYYRRYTRPDLPFLTEREIFTARMNEVWGKYKIIGDPGEEIDAFYRRAFERAAYPDVKPALAALRCKYKILIASNTDNDVLDAVMRKNGLTADGVYTSENLRCYKPNPDFYLKILHDVGYAPDEVIFMGDSLCDDIEGAQGVSIKAFLIDRSGKYKPSEIIPDGIFSEIPSDL